MAKKSIVVAFAALVLGAGPACALNGDDYAAMMGLLWRLRDPICPRLAFDPDAFAKTLKLPGGSAEAVRRRHREAFERGYAQGGDWLAEGTPKFCVEVERMFDGKHDFFGNAKETSEPPVPGLTIR
jgi:hypothetical protein